MALVLEGGTLMAAVVAIGASLGRAGRATTGSGR
jgi:hypothetical protein